MPQTSSCTNNQPRRPVLRLFRGFFWGVSGRSGVGIPNDYFYCYYHYYYCYYHYYYHYYYYHHYYYCYYYYYDYYYYCYY